MPFDPSSDLAIGARAPMAIARKIALGAGDFGFNLYWQTVSLYLLFYYTDVVGLSSTVAGTIYMAALIWDAALDPVIGSVLDRTRTAMGRYRPYLLFGGVPLALAFVAVFATPAPGGRWTLIATGLAHFGFRTIYALVSVPYTALFARVTRDARARADLAAIRIVFATSAAIVVAVSTQPLVHAMATPEMPRRGWLLLSLILGTLATLLLLLAAWGAKGFDAAEPPHARPASSLIGAARTLRHNRALLLLISALMLTSGCGTFFGKNVLYFFKYVVGREALGGLAIGFVALGAALSIPPLAWASRRYGKRESWIFGATLGVAGLLLWQLADPHSVPSLFVALALCALGSGAAAVNFWSMLPDTVEYGEWRSGVRTESLVFGVAILGQKIALGVAAGALGLSLTAVGYVANAVQTPQTLEGIRQMMFWPPLLGGGIAILLLCFYPISLQLHERIVGELEVRRINRA